jgi:glycine betaine/choline ABC-type transport system substrate-binding protein
MEIALQRLSGRITTEDMRRMNYDVDGKKQDAADVAREFLTTARLIS